SCFFFQAEDGIRDFHVTGVQTCALPIYGNIVKMNELQQLEKELLKPSEDLLEDIAKIDGDIMFLGVGGKMGPSMARLAKEAIEMAGLEKRVIGVSRFSDDSLRQELNDQGIETISADLLNDDDLRNL